MKQWIKDPEAVLDYSVDWSRLLGDVDTITALTVTPEEGVTVDSSSFTDTTTTAWISGGTAGEEYGVTFSITTAGGRTDERTITLIVRQR